MMAPIVVENEDEFKDLVQETFEKITQRSASQRSGVRSPLTFKSYLNCCGLAKWSR